VQLKFGGKNDPDERLFSGQQHQYGKYLWKSKGKHGPYFNTGPFLIQTLSIILFNTVFVTSGVIVIARFSITASPLPVIPPKFKGGPISQPE
jgi:hypothetical protein